MTVTISDFNRKNRTYSINTDEEYPEHYDIEFEEVGNWINYVAKYQVSTSHHKQELLLAIDEIPQLIMCLFDIYKEQRGFDGENT